MKAFLKNYRQSPRKVRLLADLVRGKRVTDALTTLSMTPKRASLPLKKLIESAVANAGRGKASSDVLVVKDIRVDKGIMFMRYRARARGRAAPIRKRTSHVTLALSETTPRAPKKKTASENTERDSKKGTRAAAS